MVEWKNNKAFLIYTIFFLLIPYQGFSESYKPFDHLWYGTRDIPRKENYILFGIGTAATVVAALWFNKPVNNYFVAHNNWENNQQFTNKTWGTIFPGTIIGLGLVSYGLIYDHSHEIDSGEAMIEGLVATGVYTQLIKVISNQQRPTGSNYSFPSGHTSISFSLAATFMDMYGPIAGVPALLLAIVTATGRIVSNEHWLSETLFGATLGYMVGHSYTIHHKGQKEVDEITLMPYFEGKNDFGLMLTKKF